MYINCQCSPEVQKAIDTYLELISEFEVLSSTDYLLAGGAPRDIFFNRVPSDFDIYTTQSVSFLKKLLECMSHSNEFLIYNYASEYPTEYVNGVISFKYKDINVQLISISVPVNDVILYFSCSLSMITYYSGLVQPSKEFISSYLNNTIIFYGDVNTMYRNKICVKFPQYLRKSKSNRILSLPKEEINLW